MKNILEKDLREKSKQEYCSECICDTECRGFVNVKCRGLNKETLEEAADNYSKELTQVVAFYQGAKWQEMNTERIKEIQQATAYPQSVSVQQALLKVWNETEQNQLHITTNSEVFEHYGKPFTNGRDLWDFLTTHYNFIPKT